MGGLPRHGLGRAGPAGAEQAVGIPGHAPGVTLRRVNGDNPSIVETERYLAWFSGRSVTARGPKLSGPPVA